MVINILVCAVPCQQTSALLTIQSKTEFIDYLSSDLHTPCCSSLKSSSVDSQSTSESLPASRVTPRKVPIGSSRRRREESNILSGPLGQPCTMRMIIRSSCNILGAPLSKRKIVSSIFCCGLTTNTKCFTRFISVDLFLILRHACLVRVPVRDPLHPI